MRLALFALISAVAWGQDFICDSCVKLTERPFDTPAIHRKDSRFLYCSHGIRWCDHGEHIDKEVSVTSCQGYLTDIDRSCGKEYWTCADKSRVLLTSEDGKKHCMKPEVK